MKETRGGRPSCFSSIELSNGLSCIFSSDSPMALRALPVWEEEVGEKYMAQGKAERCMSGFPSFEGTASHWDELIVLENSTLNLFKDLDFFPSFP